jgi:FabA-like domain
MRRVARHAGRFADRSSHSTAAEVSRAVRRLVGHSERVLVSKVRGDGSGGAAGEVRVRLAEMDELRGHFPGRAVLPAVLLLEAMFQVAAVRLAGSRWVDVRRVVDARFRRPVWDGEDVTVQVVQVDEPGGETTRDGGRGSCEAEEAARRVVFRGRAVMATREVMSGGDELPSRSLPGSVAVGEATFECLLTPEGY